MGGTTGKLTHFGLGKETTWGTAAAATVYLPYNSETITHAIEPLIPASLMARRWENNNLEGASTVAGDSVHEVHPAGIGYLLRSALRSPETTNNTGSYTHVFQPPAGRAILSDTAQATTSGTEIVLTAIATDDIYNGCWCHIKTGTAAGQWVIITDTVASSNKISVVTSPACVAGDTLEIVPGPQYCMHHPTYTLEIHRDLSGTTPAFRYTGCAVNNLAFNIASGAKILTATASWLGKTPSNILNTTPSLPTTDPFIWDTCVFGVGKKSGATASGAGTTTTLVDTGAFTVDAEIGNIVWTTGGTGANQCRRISDNDADSLTVSPAWHTAPDATTTYEIFYGSSLITDLNFSWNNGLVAVPTFNYSKDIHQIEADAYTTGAISKTIIPEAITDYSTYFAGWTTREWLIYFHGGLITTNHYYDLFFHFPKVRFMTYPINVGGPGGLRVASDMKIEYDATDTYAVKCVLQNNTSTYA